MSNRVNPRKRVLIIVGVVALACLLLGIGAATVGGAVYALTRVTEGHGPLTEAIALAMPARAAADGDERGIVIATVTEDGPAAEAGVARGDILLELDGEAVDTHRDLLEALAAFDPGDEVELHVLHGDDERRLTATLGEQEGMAFLGLVPCCAIRESDATRQAPERIAGTGALITEVVHDGPAAEAGLEAGDLIVAVDDQALGEDLALADAIRAHQPGERVTLTVQSPAGEADEEVTVELGEHSDEEGTAYLGVTYLAAPSARWLPFRMPQLPHLDDRPGVPDIERFQELVPEDLSGATVIEVDADSPAEEADLRVGDVILSIGGEPVDTPQDVVRTVGAHQPGDELTMTIRRRGGEEAGDEELELAITLGEHPEEKARAYLGVRLGFGGVRFRRFGGDEDSERRHWDFDLPEDLPFDLDEWLRRFDFKFSPDGGADRREGAVGDDTV